MFKETDTGGNVLFFPLSTVSLFLFGMSAMGLLADTKEELCEAYDSLCRTFCGGRSVRKREVKDNSNETWIAKLESLYHRLRMRIQVIFGYPVVCNYAVTNDNWWDKEWLTETRHAASVAHRQKLVPLPPGPVYSWMWVSLPALRIPTRGISRSCDRLRGDKKLKVPSITSKWLP